MNNYIITKEIYLLCFFLSLPNQCLDLHVFSPLTAQMGYSCDLYSLLQKWTCNRRISSQVINHWATSTTRLCYLQNWNGKCLSFSKVSTSWRTESQHKNKADKRTVKYSKITDKKQADWCSDWWVIFMKNRALRWPVMKAWIMLFDIRLGSSLRVSCS